MKSILENRPALAAEVNKVAEVAGYLWQKGWAERNGGNITVNITEFVDDEIKAMPAISEVKSIHEFLTPDELKKLENLEVCAIWPVGRWRTVRSSAFWMTVPAMSL